MSNKKVLIFGGMGMLGHKLVQCLSQDLNVYSTVRDRFSEIEHLGIFDESKTISEFNIDDPQTVADIIASLKPDVVINAIGVIKQRPTANDVVGVLSINSIFPQRLAILAEKFNFRLISLSTDCVFSGKKGNYTELDTPDATDLYGQSKRWGEVSGENCLTLRTSIIGRELRSGHSLVEWFLSNENSSVKGFSEAIYSGFPTIIIADIIKDLILHRPGLSGIFHVSSEPINKYELLMLIRDAYGVNIEIEKDEEFIIDRSLNSDKFREITGFSPCSWPQMIKKMADDTTNYSK